MSVNTYTKNKKVRLSANFSSSEFDCKGSGCCSTTKIDSQLVLYLQQIRTHFGQPLTISSGFRCVRHNAAVGGVSASRHLSGMAADIKVSGISPEEIAKYAESIGIKGIILYVTKGFVHIDTRSSKYYAKVISAKTQAVSTFAAATTKQMAVSNCSMLNVRNGAGTKHKIVKVLRNGSVVNVLSVSGNWAQIGASEWCYIKYLRQV